MASLCCNPVLRPHTAKWRNPGTNHAILRRNLSPQAVSTALKAVSPQKYVYPDPIPEFAEAETRKFKAELIKVLSTEKDNTFGDDLQKVVNVCAEIVSEFLEEEYGGPGTLLVEPFTDMMVALKEKNLPGAALASRAALIWAQKHIDRDWEKWKWNPYE